MTSNFFVTKYSESAVGNKSTLRGLCPLWVCHPMFYLVCAQFNCRVKSSAFLYIQFPELYILRSGMVAMTVTLASSKCSVWSVHLKWRPIFFSCSKELENVLSVIATQKKQKTNKQKRYLQYSMHSQSAEAFTNFHWFNCTLHLVMLEPIITILLHIK